MRDTVQAPVTPSVCDCRRSRSEGLHHSLLLFPECLTGPSQLSGPLLQVATLGTRAARQCPLAMTHLPDVAAFLDGGLRG
jgi:hypothetical protein